MSSIFRLIDSRNWKKVRSKLYSTDPRSEFSLQELNEEGQNIFHAVCSKEDVPSDIIVRLFQVNNNALFTLSKSQSLPLHYACETGSSLTVRILLQLADVLYQEGIGNSLQFYTRYLDINERTALDRVWLKYLLSNNSFYDENTPKAHYIFQNLQDMDNITSVLDLSANHKLLDTWKKVGDDRFFPF